MASSDDEEEPMLESVTNYYFLDTKDEPISFSVLPIDFEDIDEATDSPDHQVFLHGIGDGGLQKVYKQVTSWRLRLEDEKPEVMVLTKDGKWIKLLKPRKSYEETIRTIFVTIELLHFLKRKPELSEKTLWDHLRKTFISFEEVPSVNDLLDHYPLIKLLVERDEELAQCQLLLALIKEQPRKKFFGEESQNNLDSKKSFIVADDDVEEMGDNDGDESEGDSDLFDSVCAICDNGGELLCCEGRCMRSFHATKKDGEDSDCTSLRFTKAQVEAIQNFFCRNCKYKQHQCFVCGKLGSSDKSANAEVFPCVNATCGHFYHPRCVAYLLFKENEADAIEYEKKIAAGESFTCPVHKCYVCKQVENKEVKELQFAVCRRCPKSYHRKCLPRKIAFDDIEEEDIIQRAWDDLLPHRILIYCLKHKIDEDLRTPIRNHIKFPEIPERKKLVVLQRSKEKPVGKKKQVSDNLSQDRSSVKPKRSLEKVSSSEESQPVRKKRGISQQVLDFQKQLKPVKISSESELYKSDGSVLTDGRKPSTEKANSAVPDVYSPSSGIASSSSYPKIDVDTEKKITTLLKDTSSSIRLNDILKKREMQSAQSYTARNIDKNITHGKVEGFVEAVRAALLKLDDGGIVEDAKAVCESGILTELIKWNNKLKVYLAPIIYGTRYTSFGRHFTQVSKLMEIGDKLQSYVQDGDTIVDFCCGANDFSLLMQEKLDAAGKKNCRYKNFDLIQSKNDFNFERRSWFSVMTDELPTGSKLIMGLNPPFGVKGKLANDFIDKALTFKPKLLILIVPPETQRLDEKSSPYDLIWEDREKLSGKSFYLPGSVDVYDMQIEQWNNTPPPLYLWSRPDWTSRHREIALKQGHLSKGQQESRVEEETQPQTNDVKKSPKEIAERHGNKEPIIPEDTDKEGNSNKKIAEGYDKRSPPTDNHNNMSRNKRRKAKRKEQAKARQRNEDEPSDMSISPPDTRHFSKSQLPSETSMERPSEVRSLVFGTTSEVGRGTTSILDADDIAKRYATPSNRDGYVPGSSYNWSSDRMGSNREYSGQNPEERFPSYSNVDTLSRNYTNGYGRSVDSDARMPISRNYGFEVREDPLQRGRFPLGSSDHGLGHSSMFPSSSPYGVSSLNTEASVTQRYAARLDEPNYLRGPANLGPVGLGGRNDALDIHGMRERPPPGTLGFAPGPRHGFPHHGSGGWLDD